MRADPTLEHSATGSDGISPRLPPSTSGKWPFGNRGSQSSVSFDCHFAFTLWGWRMSNAAERSDLVKALEANAIRCSVQIVADRIDAFPEKRNGLRPSFRQASDMAEKINARMSRDSIQGGKSRRARAQQRGGQSLSATKFSVDGGFADGEMSGHGEDKRRIPNHQIEIDADGFLTLLKLPPSEFEAIRAFQ